MRSPCTSSPDQGPRNATGFDDGRKERHSPLRRLIPQSHGAGFFFVLLVLVFAELGFRFYIVWCDLHNESKQETEDATRRLAKNVKSITLNSGDPVAARTMRWLNAMALALTSLQSLAVEKTFPQNCKTGRNDASRISGESTIPGTANYSR